MKRYLDISFKYMKTQKKMRGLTILAIIIATMLIVAIGNFAYASFEGKISKSKREYGDYRYRYERITEEVARKIEKDEKVGNPAIARDEGYIYLKVNSKNKKELFLGLNSLDERVLKNIFTIEIEEGTYPKNSNEIIISRELFNLIGESKKVGDILELPVGKYPFKVDDKFIADKSSLIWMPEKTKSLKIVGITKNEVYREKPREFIDYTIITFLDNKEPSIMGDDSYKIFTTIDSKMYAEKLANKLGLLFIANSVESTVNLEGAPKSQVKFQMYTDMVLNERNIINNEKVLIPTIFIVLFIMAMIYNSFNISLLERIKQFGILRCIGATKRQIKRIVFVECLIMLAISLPVGILVGTFGVKGLLCIINRVLRYDLFYIQFYKTIILFSIIIICISVVLAAFRAVVTEDGLSPVEAMNNFAILNKLEERKSNRVFRIESGIKGGNGEKFLSKWFKVEGNMAYKNVDRNEKRSKVCTFSLAFSIILFICLTNVFLSQRNDANKIVPSDKWNMEVARSYDYFNDDDFKKLGEINGIKNIYKNTFVDSYVSINRYYLDDLYKDVIRYREQNTDGIRRSEQEGVNLVTRIMMAADDLTMYGDYLQLGKVSKEGLDDDGVIIVNSGEKEFLKPVLGGFEKETSKLTYMTRLNIGDTITIPLNPQGKIYKVKDKDVKFGVGIKLKVVAVVSRDPFNNKQDFKEDFGVILSEKIYKKVIGNTNFNSIYINGDSDEGKRPEMVKAIKSYSTFGADETVDYIEKEKDQKNDADKGYKSGIAFGVMILLMGMLNVTNTLSANILVRRKELASLRSVGMTEHQMIKMVVLEGGFTGYKAAFPGILFGVIFTLGGQIYLFQNKEKWAVVIWLISIITSVILIMMLTLLSTISPAKSLEKMSIVDNIKSEEV